MNDKMIKACIFDLDGTIADTLESMAYVANEIMEKFSLKPQPTDNFRYYSGEGADMLIKRSMPEIRIWSIMKKSGNFTVKNLMKIPCIKLYHIRICRKPFRN